eukprot:1183182-Prymnesium_polylepis.1
MPDTRLPSPASFLLLVLITCASALPSIECGTPLAHRLSLSRSNHRTHRVRPRDVLRGGQRRTDELSARH